PVHASPTRRSSDLRKNSAPRNRSDAGSERDFAFVTCTDTVTAADGDQPEKQTPPAGMRCAHDRGRPTASNRCGRPATARTAPREDPDPDPTSTQAQHPPGAAVDADRAGDRSEEHTSELQ